MKKYDLYLTGTAGWNYSAGYVKYILDNSKGKPVTVAISSLGGYVATGLQIYEMFRNHGEVTVEFIGMSASAATFMAMGAKNIKMAKNALILIHNSMTWVDEWGTFNKEQIDESIKRLKFERDQLSTIDDVLAQIYADRNGKSVDDVKAKMKIAAWIKAADAVDFGIVDEIIEAESVDDGVANVSNKLTNSLISNMGLPPLPAGFNAETGEDNPAGILEKAIGMLKRLGNSFAVNQEKSMKKIFKSVMAVLAIQDGIEANDKGEMVLNEEQMKKIDDQLTQQEEACKQAKSTIDSQKKTIADLQAEVDSQKKEIENLKKVPGETKNGGEDVVETSPLNAAAELFKSIKDAI